MSALTSLSRPRYTLGVFDANILEERIMRLLEKRPRLGAQRAKLLLGAAASALALVGLGACAFSFTAQENAQAQTLATEPSNPSADFSGRWELDKAKSDLPSPAPENLVQVIEQRGSELKFTTSSKDWDTNKPIAVTLFALMVPELSITADNRESVQPYGPGQMRAKSRWGDGKLITEWTLDRDGQVMMTGQWVRSLSKDGKTQTIEITAHDPNRNLDGEARAVFVKTGGGARAFLGTWRGEFQGKTFLVLTLQEEGGSLSGTIGIGGFSIDSSGQVKQVKSEPEAGEDTPIFDARWDGSLLTFKTKAGMPTTEYQFQMRVTGESAAELKGVTPPPPPGTPVGGWWKLSRQPDDSSTEIDQGGPHGGVVGGVKGGVEGGVRGYMVGVIGGIVGGVPGQGENKGTNLSGTVFDPSGARVPNTILEIDGDAGFKKISAANNVGEFSFTGLPDGRYELQAIHDGFSPFLQNVVVSQGSVRISGAPSGGQVKLGLTPGPGAVSPMINIVLDPISAMPSEGATAIAPPEVVVSQGEVVEKRRAAAPELKLERRVEPEYPPLAKAAGIEGRVVLDVTVDADGTVSDIKVVGGHPLLVKAALDAVRQWKYAASAQLPATTTVTLQFRLPEEAAGRGVVGGVPTREEKNTVDLSGTVSDPSGARVPNALVTLYGKSGSKKTAATNDAGEFSFTGLAPGDYEWKVYRDGFEVTQQKLTVSNGALKSQEGKRDVLVLAMPSPRLDIVLAPSSPMQSMVVTAKAPPEVAEKRRAAAPKRIRVGGEVEATKVLTQVPPKYPESARAKGIEGTVLLEAVISMEGVPLSLHVLESPDPELSDAALAAVRQWRYQPTLLNGQPIEVVTTIAINFHLEG
jgi:TonB family protein